MYNVLLLSSSTKWTRGLGIKGTQNCNNWATVNFTKCGFTKTMVHTMFDEIPNDIARYLLLLILFISIIFVFFYFWIIVYRFGVIRHYGCKTFENFVKELRKPALQKIAFVQSGFYNHCTKVFAQDLSLSLAVETNMYVS